MFRVNARSTSVVIVGGGPGGYEAALVAAQLGADVTVIDSDGIGGAAVLTDCVPSKTLLSTSTMMGALDRAQALGVHVTPRAAGAGADATELARVARADLRQVNDRVIGLARAQSDDVLVRLRDDGVRVVHGRGRLLSASAVRAELADHPSVDATGPIKVVFGSLRSGDAANVIPTHATLAASVRTPSMATWEALPEAFRRAVDALVSSTGASYECDYVHGVPPVVNDPAVTESVRRAAADELEGHPVTEAEQSWGGDDFAWYLREVPGAYVRLGTHDPGCGHEPHDLHVGHFDVDERAIPIGIRLLTAAAFARLHELT